MYGHLTPDCLDRWLNDVDEFRGDFLRHCQTISKALGLYFEFDQEAIHIAHSNWRSQAALWKKSYVMPNTNSLSHLKLLAILLYQLACVEWIRDLYEFDPEGDRREADFTGTPEQREKVRADINAGRGTYLAFQFVVQVVNWFEDARIDRSGKFVFRLTSDLEHDIMVYLLSERREEMGTYLILKALYTRHPKKTKR